MRNEFCAIAVALCRCCELRVGAQGFQADDATQSTVLRVVADRHDQVALAALEDLVGHHVRMGVAHAGRNLSREKVVDGLVRIDRHHAIEQRHVDVLSLAADVAMFQRSEDGRGRIHAREQVGDGDAHFHGFITGRPLGLAGHAHQSAHALKYEVVAGQRRVRPVLTEAGDRAVHKPRIQGAQVVRTETVAGQCADLVILDNHVDVAYQIADQRLPFGVRQVDGDGFFATVCAEKVGGISCFQTVHIFQERWPPRTGVVSNAGTLNLDHFCPHVGQILRCPRARQNAGQVEHLDVPQCGLHVMFL